MKLRIAFLAGLLGPVAWLNGMVNGFVACISIILLCLAFLYYEHTRDKSLDWESHYYDHYY